LIFFNLGGKMTDEVKGGGAAPEPDAGGDGGKKSVSYDSYQKLLSEKKSRDAKLKELEEKMTAIELERQQQEDAKLQEQGQFKALLEKEQASKKELESRLNALQTGLQNSIKRRAVEEKIGTRFKKDEYAAFLPYDQIRIDSETMEIDEESVLSVAELMQKEHRALFEWKTGGKQTPGDAPQATGKLTYDSWLKLPLKEQKARIKDVIK